MATEGIKYLYYSFLFLIKEDSRYIDDNKLLNSYINNIKDDNNFYLMKIAQMLKKFPDIMVKIDPLIYKAYSDDLYFHIIKNHHYFAAAAAAVGAGGAAAVLPDGYDEAIKAATAAGVTAAGGAPAAPAAPAALRSDAAGAPDAPAALRTAAAAAVTAVTDAAAAALGVPVINAVTLIAYSAIAAYNSANDPNINNVLPAFAVAAPAGPAVAAPAGPAVAAPANNFKIKLFCDLILFDILCRMNFNNFDSEICESNRQISKFLTHITSPTAAANTTYNTATLNIIDNYGNINTKSRKEFLKDNKKGIEKMNDYIGNFTIPMDKKIILYKILNFLINDDFIDNSTEAQIIKVMFELITHKTDGCAPRTILEELSINGGNKSGKYEYFLCKCNFKDSLKKVVAKSAREAAKILAKKVLKGNKKSIKFTLKRIIGKKEKYYNYEAHFDKKGKIIIKNQ